MTNPKLVHTPSHGDNVKEYTCKSFGQKYVVSVKYKSEVVTALTQFCEDHAITAGTISGIGAVNEATLRYFDSKQEKYVEKTFNEQMEVLNVTGNISLLEDSSLYLHIHIVLGRNDFSAVAGHLGSAVINGAGEFIIEPLNGNLRKVKYYDTRLNLFDLE